MNILRITVTAAALLLSPIAFAEGDEAADGPADTADGAAAEDVAGETAAEAPAEPACDKGISMTPDELVASMNAGADC